MTSWETRKRGMTLIFKLHSKSLLFNFWSVIHFGLAPLFFKNYFSIKNFSPTITFNAFGMT